MTTIPANTVTPEDLITWNQMKEQMAKLKAAEMLLRTKIFKAYFPAPKEGTNTVPLANGWVLKGTYKIERKPDPALLAAFAPSLREQGINPDALIKYAPELITKAYRELTAEQEQLFDRVLVVKPGAPSLEIVLPAKAAK